MRTSAIWGLLTLSMAAAQICPPPESLAPCLCYESNRTIACRDIRGRFNMKQIFDRAASFVGDDVTFDDLTVHNTPLVELEDGTFDSWKFTNVSITSNENLIYISPNAFNASRQVTKKLNLGSLLELEGDLFEFVRCFVNLSTLLILRAVLPSVPDNAFENLHSLETIQMQYTGINEFGNRTFSQLPNLKTVTLQYNNFTVIPAGAFKNLTALEKLNLRSNGISLIRSKAFSQTDNLNFVDLYGNEIMGEGHDSDAFEGIGANATVDLTYNNAMGFLGQQGFQPLLERASIVKVGGVSCNRNGCFYKYLYCDERADWICDNLEEYEEKLTGFLCYERLGWLADYCKNKGRK